MELQRFEISYDQRFGVAGVALSQHVCSFVLLDAVQSQRDDDQG